MSKRLNEQAMQSELTGSAFFRPAPQGASEAHSPTPNEPSQSRQPSVAKTKPAQSKPAEVSQPISNPERVETIEPTGDRSNVRTNERHHKRPKVRHSFDIFTDQLLSLRQIALEREALSGERVLLGDLVQEALDLLITIEKKGK